MQIGSRRAILNPASGTSDHADRVSRLLEGRGFRVERTAAAGDAAALAREAAAADVSELAVCGGDGTVNEVVRGLDDADHLDAVTLSVVPCGTANLLANNVGVRGVDHGVDVADTGEVRTVDVGVAGDEPFLVSCIVGFPAAASAAASSELKERLGTLAFVVTGVQEALSFDPVAIRLEARGDDGVETWAGEATCLLVGNARRFVGEGGQADMEDGAFDVAIVEQMPAGNLVAEAISHRVLGRDTDSVTHLTAEEVHVEADDDDLTVSRDGELDAAGELRMSAREATLDLRVGDGYNPRLD
ncbi:MAG: diacylglycerol kinase family protein [Halolamina sp.]